MQQGRHPVGRTSCQPFGDCFSLIIRRHWVLREIGTVGNGVDVDHGLTWLIRHFMPVAMIFAICPLARRTSADSLMISSDVGSTPI
jgi:hypothetical protein